MKYCRNCGQQLFDEDNFCHKCGSNQNKGDGKKEHSALVDHKEDNAVIIYRDRSKWQGFLALGSGVVSVIFTPIVIYWGVFGFQLSIGLGIVMDILAIILVIATINCFMNFRSRMQNKDIKEECVYFGNDRNTIIVVDIHRRKHVVSSADLCSCNKKPVGKGNILYINIPESGITKSYFCGYCQSEADLLDVLKNRD